MGYRVKDQWPSRQINYVGQIVTIRDISKSDPRARGVRVIRFRHEKILAQEQTQQMGRELFGCFDADETDSGNSDPNSDYCVDWQGLEYLDTVGLGKLVVFNNKHKTFRGRGVGMINISPPLQQVLRIIGLDRVFDIHDTLDDYLAVR
jgi:hypothetical protein